MLGPAMFKMLRVLSYVVVSVHLACCMYYRVKVETSPVSDLDLHDCSLFYMPDHFQKHHPSFVVSVDCRKIQTHFQWQTSCCLRTSILRLFHSELDFQAYSTDTAV